MRLKVLACETLWRELFQSVAQSPHVCDMKLLSREMHDDLDTMQQVLQEEIDLTNAADTERDTRQGVTCPVCEHTRYDAVILFMGLCGNTTHGLRVGSVPVVLPRVHDCAGLLLGGNERYMAEEQRTVFYHQGAVERFGASRVDAVPRYLGLGRTLEEYVQEYGQENGRYIYEMEYSFAAYNDRALFLYFPDTPDTAQRCREDVEEYIRGFEWEIVSVPVDLSIMQSLLNGDWTEDNTIVTPPNECIAVTVDRDGFITQRRDGVRKHCTEACSK